MSEPFPEGSLTRQLVSLSIRSKIPFHVLKSYDPRIVATYLDIYEEADFAEKQAMKGASNG